jgi:hypothetical protein
MAEALEFRLHFKCASKILVKLTAAAGKHLNFLVADATLSNLV